MASDNLCCQFCDGRDTMLALLKAKPREFDEHVVWYIITPVASNVLRL